jgi:hypothetical protein
LNTQDTAEKSASNTEVSPKTEVSPNSPCKRRKQRDAQRNARVHGLEFSARHTHVANLRKRLPPDYLRRKRRKKPRSTKMAETTKQRIPAPEFWYRGFRQAQLEQAAAIKIAILFKQVSLLFNQV